MPRGVPFGGPRGIRFLRRPGLQVRVANGPTIAILEQQRRQSKKMTLTPFVVIFAAFGFSTAGLALYRKVIAMKEDDYLHVTAAEQRYVPQQVAMAHTMHSIDVWGKTLTALTVASGLVLLAAFLYVSWVTRQA
jgi:hypothetical protein